MSSSQVTLTRNTLQLIATHYNSQLTNNKLPSRVSAAIFCSVLQCFAVCCLAEDVCTHCAYEKKSHASRRSCSSVTGAHACHRDRATRTFAQSGNALSIATYRKSLQRTAHCNTLQCVCMYVGIYVLATAAAGAVVTGSTEAVTCDMPHSHVWHDSFKL